MSNLADHLLLDLEPAPRQMPVLSIVGLAAFTLAIVIFGLTQWQNTQTLNQIEHLQAHQAVDDAARAPQTRIGLCNGLRVAVAVIQPVGPDQRRAIAVLKQNIRVLDCPATIAPLPTSPPYDLP